MAGKSLIIFGHHSDFVLDVWESDAKKLVEEFEGFTELMEDIEEVIKDDSFVLLVFLHDFVGVLDDGFDWEGALLVIFHLWLI